MSKPHKHAAVIKAWADGAEIECLHRGLQTWRMSHQPLWNEDAEYRIADPYRELKEAHARGETIECKGTDGWFKVASPTWWPGTEYRIHDQYRDLKEAHARGEKIEFCNLSNRRHPILKPIWCFPAHYYRIAPKEVPNTLNTKHFTIVLEDGRVLVSHDQINWTVADNGKQ
jgi:hypothetical protein